MFKLYNIINWGFPLYLVLFEVVLRSISNIESSGFIGPTLAASGMGLLISIVKPVNVDRGQPLQQNPQNQNITITYRNSRDEKLIVSAWVALLFQLLAWYWICAESVKAAQNNNNSVKLMIAGAISYFVCVLIFSLKETN